MRRKHWVTVLTVLVAVLLLSGTEAAGALVVERYRPPVVAPGADVGIYGSGFGRQKPQHVVRYGTTGSPLGQAEIRAWTGTRIDVRLPAAIPPERYWLAIYEGDTLKSNQFRVLNVERAGVPAGSTQRSGTALPGVRIDPPRARVEQPLRALSLDHFRPDRVGTSFERYTRKEGGRDCPEPDRDTFAPAGGGGQAYTGYVKYFDTSIGGERAPCWDYSHQHYRGMVRFDVSGLRGKTIERADLSFRATIVKNENDTSCARTPIAIWRILARPFNAGLQEGIVGTDTAEYPTSVVAGGQYKMELTNLVRLWANGDRANQGVVFIGRDETASYNNNKCVVRMSDFDLKVDFH